MSGDRAGPGCRGRVIEGRQLTDRRTVIDADICIVGSGAGGGVCALKLAEAGLDVIVLEEGPNVAAGAGRGGDRHVRPGLVEDELDAYSTLYQEGGFRATEHPQPPVPHIRVLQGRCLGGGTTVNWSACLPPPAATLRHWHDTFGLPFSPSGLEELLLEVVNVLHVHENRHLNAAARALRDGCAALGWHADCLPNNTRRCLECGSCGLGCPYDRKRSGPTVWLSQALDHGAAIYTDAHVDRLVRGGDELAVEATLLERGRRRRRNRLTVRPRHGVVLAAGAIGSPAVLLRSELVSNPLLGRFTHVHPTTACVGEYGRPTYPAYGVPANMYSAEFADGPTGYLIESGSSQPVMSALASLATGEELRRWMRDVYPRSAVLYAHHNAGWDPRQPYGTVRLEGDEPVLRYELAPDNVAAMRASLKRMTEIHLAAGATAVHHLTNPALHITSRWQLGQLDFIKLEPQRTSLFAAHVMGGCRMGGDGVDAVVDTDFAVRGAPDVWVVDGSVFPTGLGAGPQMTIYALALWAARAIIRNLLGANGRFELSYRRVPAAERLRLPWTAR